MNQVLKWKLIAGFLLVFIASDSTGNEYQKETGNKFPFQHLVHSENSS